MKLFLKLNSLLVVLLFSCSSPYKKLIVAEKHSSSAIIYKPFFEKELYRCVVNGRVVFKKFHLSGILLFKKLETGTIRAVFQNEMGFTFFDFEWNANDSFKVNQVIPQLDKPAVLKILKKDMNLLLMKGLDLSSEKYYISDRGKADLSRYTLEKGYAYYISEQGKLVRIENAGEKSKVITITLKNKINNAAMPDTVVFDHHKANFTIELTKIETHADE